MAMNGDTFEGKSYSGNTNIAATSYRGDADWSAIKGTDSGNANWGANARRSKWHTTGDLSANGTNSSLLTSRLWHGVPQLTADQLSMFEAAYTGHTFIFVVDVPSFMYKGIYNGTKMHESIKNLKAVIERASTGFDGPANSQANTSDVEDGAGRKISHVTSVTKDQNNVTLRLHEFAGLPVKNALENWLTGIYDIRSQHGNYHGNLGIPGGWCLKNHSMSMLVVQVTPDWTTIQDAAYYFNMVPTEVPFDHFDWTKGEQNIVDDYSIDFVCNEERSPAIMYAAEKYMNNRILSMVGTSVYNSRQFVVNDFNDGSLADDGFKANLKDSPIIDDYQYNQYIKSPKDVAGNADSKHTMVGMGMSDSSIEDQNVNEDGTE